jgi:2-phosphosulfolactate phosphatase
VDIHLYSLMEGARRARGTAVIIDVYRAFTTAAVALKRGARRIIMVDDPQKALELRNKGIGDLCTGETDGVPVPGFDFGNSPYALSRAELGAKTLIQSTSAGTRGVAAASGSGRIYAAALVNAAATADAILRERPDTVWLVAMGNGGNTRSDEDEQCALYLRNRLRGCRQNRAALRSLVRSAWDSRKFGNPHQPHFDPKDRNIALQIDSIPLAVRVRRVGGLLIATAETDVGSGAGHC